MSWLKFDTDTPEKPEVLAITVAMGWDDPDLTVGKLLKVWRWFDKHTVDGNAASVTPPLLDRIIGVTGLADAMVSVGWLLVEEGGLRLPKFDRHNGQTAKDRALTAQRVAKSKNKAKGNASGNGRPVTTALPREEKRREELQAPCNSSPTPAEPASPAGAVSDDEPPPAAVQFPNPAAGHAIALNRAGFRCTSYTPDLVAAVAEGVSVAQLAELTAMPDFAGKPAAYLIRAARRMHAERAQPVPVGVTRHEPARKLSAAEQVRAAIASRQRDDAEPVCIEAEVRRIG